MAHLFTFENTTRAKLPRVDFLKIKDEILGKDYDLTLTIVDAKKI